MAWEQGNFLESSPDSSNGKFYTRSETLEKLDSIRQIVNAMPPGLLEKDRSLLEIHQTVNHLPYEFEEFLKESFRN